MTAQEAGFVAAGSCRLDPALLSGVRFTVTALQDQRVVYAFSVDGVIKYIGVCNTPNTTLRQRMKRYQGMMGSGTNRRVTLEIKAALFGGSRISILALQPQGSLKHGKFAVDLVKGLENPLIETFHPLWNVQGHI